MKQIITCFLITLIALSSNAQNEEDYNVKKGLVIVFSTKNYKEAKKFAAEASKKLVLKLDLRGLAPVKDGLSYSKADCEGSEWYYPCYTQRGRDDDEEYINHYNGLTKNLYIVVAATGDKTITQPALKKVKKVYRNAFVKQTSIYVGCLH